MAKDLPYFKFYCSEWSDGDITLESYETQGLFINICAYYWSNECIVSYDKLLKKFRGSESIIKELINLQIIKLNDINVNISFLDEQLFEREVKSQKSSIAGRISAEKKKLAKIKQEVNENSTDVEIMFNETSTESQPLREEKRREEKRNINSNLKIDWEKLLFQFNSITGKESKVVNSKTKNAIIARLKEGYEKQDLVNAIQNCFNDPYHKETNHKYLTLEFISRADKMEKYSTIKDK